MQIGFTGTRNGMTHAQIGTFIALMYEMKPDVFHHGDCIGADEEAAHIAKALGSRIICHPPINPDDRAFVESDETRSALTYFERNRNIVNESELLIGASFGPTEHPTGGTWYTIRYAQKKRKPVIVIWPDGTTERR